MLSFQTVIKMKWIKLLNYSFFNWNKKMFPPGIEPGTFCVLDRCDNHYTTETWVSPTSKIIVEFLPPLQKGKSTWDESSNVWHWGDKFWGEMWVRSGKTDSHGNAATYIFAQKKNLALNQKSKFHGKLFSP